MKKAMILLAAAISLVSVYVRPGASFSKKPCIYRRLEL